MKRKKPITANPGAMKKTLESQKADTRLLGKIERHMMAGHGDDDGRDQTRLHVSEIAKADWCPRQSYYRLAGYPERTDKVDNFSFTLENIFDEGHEIHAKWQRRIDRLGMLRGKWECLHCSHTWEAVSPRQCPRCEWETSVVYREVPIRNEEHYLIGHADGDIAEGNKDIAQDPLLEIKSIGIGTLRFEAPNLLADHQYEVDTGKGKPTKITDLDGVWRSLRRPLNSHLRQGNLYMALTGRRFMIFLYECKWHQQVREFVVRHRESISEPLLDAALDVKYALKKHQVPERPSFITEPDNRTCNPCPFKGTCWSAQDEEDPRSEARDLGRGGTQAPRSDEAAAGPSADVRSPEGSSSGRRVVRRRPHAAVRWPDTVDRSPRR